MKYFPAVSQKVTLLGNSRCSMVVETILASFGYLVERTALTSGTLPRADFYVLERHITDKSEPLTEHWLRQMPPGSVIFGRRFGVTERELLARYGVLSEELFFECGVETPCFAVFIIERMASWSKKTLALSVRAR